MWHFRFFGVVAVASVGVGCLTVIGGNSGCENQADCAAGSVCTGGQCQPAPGQDAGGPDGGASRDDAGQPDAGPPDSGAFADAGADPVDAGRLDAGSFDAGARDAGGSPFDAGPACPAPSGVGAPFHLRVVAANISSGNGQSYDPGEGQRILQGLHPDIVMIQEFNYSSNTDSQLGAFANSLDTTSDAGMFWSRGGFGSIPNGVISRWPILGSGDWVDPEVDNRAFTWAHVDLPGPRDLWVVSTHLLTKGASYRNSEAQALIGFLNASVPETDFLVVGGDFNTDSRTEAALSTLAARLETVGPHPADQAGVTGTNASRQKPYDWVLASRCLFALQVPVAAGTGQYSGGLVVDTRVYNPIAELAPALASDSAATNMQHMAVVKDFVVAP